MIISFHNNSLLFENVTFKPISHFIYIYLFSQLMLDNFIKANFSVPPEY